MANGPVVGSNSMERITVSGAVNTVLGPVDADELGVVAAHEALLSVYPGAQYAHDIVIDRAEIFETLAASLREFRALGGGTVVDSTGMFHGRDLPLLETLSRSTGVHIVASTGLGPEELLGGYFLTPQTNPPTPWPADKFAELFGAEARDGMVIPRLERRAPAGLITTTVTTSGATATDESMLRGAARAAVSTGVPVSFRCGADPVAELEVILSEGLAAERVAVAGLDSASAIDSQAPRAVVRRGAWVLIEGADPATATLVADLVEAGHADRILLGSGLVGVVKGHAATEGSLSALLTELVPQLRERGIDESTIQRILRDNPREYLTVR